MRGAAQRAKRGRTKASRRNAASVTSVAIVGAGKVGTALARAARAAGLRVTLRAARRALPARPFDAELVVLAVRDRELGPLAGELATRRLVAPSAVCVHVAGALDAGVLAPLRAVCRGVAQMHPMISFADIAAPPPLVGGHVHVRGDAAAERRARAFARALGLTPRTFGPSFDAVGYHAAAAFVANGAAALAALGERILVAAGVPAAEAPHMLGPLLGSVARNLDRIPLPGYLTGPVRRGDAGAIARHYDVLAARVPQALGLYLASAAAQLPLARRIGDAPAARFDEVEATLRTLAQRARDGVARPRRGRSKRGAR